MQRSDSPARNVPAFWLGDPASGWRWPFDARFDAWKVWALTTPVAFLAIWLAVPLVFLLALATHGLHRHVARTAHPVVVRRRNISGHLAGAALVLVCLAVAPSWRVWLLPMPWYLALLAAPCAALLLTRAVMPHVSPNTPLAYWINLLPRIAGGPRAHREPRALAVAPGGPTSAPASRALSDIELIALSLDPREVTMPTAKPRVATVEYDQWLPASTTAAPRTLVWAGQKGLQPQVEGNNLALVDAHSKARKIVVYPGQYIVFDASKMQHDRVTVLPPSVFAQRYETTSA